MVNRLKRVITLGLAMMLVFSTVLPMIADAAQSGAKQSVQVGDGVNVVLQQAMVVPFEENQLLSFTIEVKNQGASTVNFYNQYWFKLSNAQGRHYSIKMVKPNSYKVSPGQSKKFSYYATLPKNVNASQLSLNLIQWDFSAASFERDLAKFSLQKAVQNSISQPKKEIAIHYFEQPVHITVNTYSFADLGDSQSAYLSTTLQNKGDYPLTLPDLQYELITPQGKVYPLKANQTGIALSPDEKVQVTLFSTLPPKQQLNGSTLYVLTPTEKDKPVPLAAVKLQGKSQTTTTKWVGTPITVQLSEQEAVQVQLGDLYHQAKGSSVTLILVGSTGSKTEHVVPLEYRWTNETVWHSIPADTAVVKNGKTYITLTIPNTVNLNAANITIYFKPASGDAQSAVALQLSKQVVAQTPIQEIYPGVQLTMAGSYHYPSAGQEVVVAQVQVTNKGEYAFRLPKWNFHYEAMGGKKYNADWTIISNVSSDVIGSGEQATLLVTGYVPFGISDQNLRLALGETFTIKEVDFTVNLQAFSLALSKLDSNQPVITEATIQNQDREITYTLHELKQFETPNQNVMIARFLTENRSNRFFDFNDTIGFFQTKEGIIFPATQLPTNAGIRTPLQKDMVTFFAKVPKGVKADDLKIMLAEALPMSKTTGNDNDKQQPLVAGKVHYFSIKPTEKLTTIKEIEVYPYQLTLSNFRFNKEGTEYRFTLEKEMLDFIQERETTPNIRLEVREDNKSDGKLLLSKDIVLDGENVTSSGEMKMEPAADINLEPGNDGRWVFVNRFQSKQPTLYIYEITNDGIKGAKFLLAEYKLY